MNSNEKARIPREILHYLTNHPGTQDTLEGIVEWCLLEQAIQHWTEKVKEALAELVAQGFVIETRGADGRARYRINQKKADQIHQLIDQEVD
ncbi:MAG: hypothetical protein JST85_15730 [Acidobacteria bacterium]|nr:hypothetical protein [Acidobacteriota bacterium]